MNNLNVVMINDFVWYYGFKLYMNLMVFKLYKMLIINFLTWKPYYNKL